MIGLIDDLDILSASTLDFVCIAGDGPAAGEIHHPPCSVLGDQQGFRPHAAGRVDSLHHHHGDLKL